jgi:adenylate cyclase
MESHGRGQCIQITRNTYELIKDEFDCDALGSIDVKGAGRTEVWHLIDRKGARLTAVG